MFGQPKVDIEVMAGSSQTATAALAKWVTFTALVSKHGLELVTTEGKAIRLRGKQKRVLAFRAEYGRLARAGLV